MGMQRIFPVKWEGRRLDKNQKCSISIVLLICCPSVHGTVGVDWECILSTQQCPFCRPLLIAQPNKIPKFVLILN